MRNDLKKASHEAFFLRAFQASEQAGIYTSPVTERSNAARVVVTRAERGNCVCRTKFQAIFCGRGTQGESCRPVAQKFFPKGAVRPFYISVYSANFSDKVMLISVREKANASCAGKTSGEGKRGVFLHQSGFFGTNAGKLFQKPLKSAQICSNI